MMSMEMYAAMTAFLTVMLSVFLIVAWSILGKVFGHYRNSREVRGNLRFKEPGESVSGWRLPLYKAVPVALALAWLIVHFVIRP